MADRTVKVTLRANVTDFNQQVKQASSSLEDVARAGDKTGQVADTGLGRLAQKAQLMGGEMTTVGAATAAFGAGLLAVSVNAVKVAADFDAAMSIVQADTHESAENMALLRDAAIEAGAATAFSATEAAQGIDELAKAGVSTSDILSGGLSGALDLAAAGGISVGDAAETAASAMTQFGLSGRDVTHVADLLAAGAGKAQGGVGDLGEALGNVGVVASSMGISIEETTGALAAFASTGLVGAEAGTALKSMLNALRSPSTKAAQTMEDLGISAYDAQGNFVGLAGIAGQLRSAMSGLSQAERDAAMSRIFGSYAVTAATILYQQGAEGIQDWTNKVNDSGYASETAAARMDNLGGDLEALGGSLETLWIKMGTGAQGPLRSLVQGVTGVVDAFARLPAPVQQGITVVAGLGGAALVAVGVFMTILPRIVETRAAMATLGISFSAAKDRLVIFTKAHAPAITAGAALATAFIALGRAASESFDKAAASSDTMKNSINANVSTMQLLETTFKGADMSNGLGFGEATPVVEDFGRAVQYAADPGVINEFGQAISGAVGADTATDLGQIRAQFEKLGEALASLDASTAAATFQDLVEQAGGTEEAAQNLLDVMPAYRDSLEQVAAAAGLATDDQTLLDIAMGRIDVSATGAGTATGDAAGGISSMGDAAQDTAEQLDNLVEGLEKLYGLVLSQRDAQRGLYDAIQSANEEIARNGRTLDISTEKGRANQEAIDGIASSTWKLVDSMRQNGASAEEMQQAMQQGREALISAAQAAGMTADEANALANELGLIPDMVHVEVDAETEQARQEVYDLELDINSSFGIISIDGQDHPAQQKLSSLLGLVEDSNGNVTIGGNAVPANQTLASLLGLVENSDGTITINGDNGPATLAADSVKVKIDSTTGQVTIEGRDAASNTLTTIKGRLDAINDKTVTLRVNETRYVYAKQMTALSKADGGAVYGPGTSRSDSIPARLSNGEHVWTAAEVRAAGGQARIYRLRALARAGLLKENILGFADGGGVGYRDTIPSVTVAAPRTSANLTIVMENPVSGEKLTKHIRDVADGRIVYASTIGA